VFQAVSCLLGCLPGQYNDNNQPSTSYALLRRVCFNLLTNIDFRHACVLDSRSGLEARLTALRAQWVVLD